MNNRLNKILFTIIFLLVTTQVLYAETVTYYVNDNLGSPVAAMDSSGKRLWGESYHPYGETRINPSQNANDVGFTGHQKDDVTGLTYMQARYYDPVVGRFMSNDPVEFSNIHNFNRYAYANNNPYKYVDPDGNESIAAQQFDIEARGVGSGQITRSQHAARVSGRATASRHIAKFTPIGRIVLTALSVAEIALNESSDESDSDDDNKKQDEKDKGKDQQREKGERWTSDQDAEEQFQGIEREQNRRRKQGDNTSIESTDKSRQRANHNLKPHNIDLDRG